MEIPPVRGMISILRGGNVMPMEKFVAARVGLATLGGVRIVLDLGLFSPLVCVCAMFVCETLEGGKFYAGVMFAIRVEFLS
jgi:hypothetical protein